MKPTHPLRQLCAPLRRQGSAWLAFMQRRTLGQRLHFLLLVAALPLCLIAGYQALTTWRTSEAIAREFPLFVLAQRCESHMNVFMEGVTEAVDSGRLNRKAQEALTEVRRLCARLDGEAGVPRAALAADLNQISSNLAFGSELAALLPLQPEIYRSFKTITEDSERRRQHLDHIVSGSVDTLRRDTGLAFVTALLSLSLAFVIGRSLIRSIVRIEQRSRAASSLNQAIMDTAPIGVVTLAADARIVSANRACHSMHGYAQGSLVGQDIGLLDAGPVDIAGPLTPAPVSLHVEDERAYRRHDGSLFPAGVHAVPLADEQGRSLGTLRVIMDISDRKRAAAHMQHLALHDTLTGLPNRLLLQQRATQLLQPGTPGGPGFALALVDLDRFKPINDTLGHAVGDEVLKTVARRLSEAVRTSDTVARMGGDEFAILLPEVAHPHQAAEVADKILGTLAAVLPIDGHRLHVSASVGFAFHPAHGTDLATLLRHADFAMYDAKSRGRDTVSYYDESMARQVDPQTELRADLRLALARNELVLHYQPQVDAASGAVLGLEALMRWQHPTRGLVPPDQFIPLAEDTGLIVPMGAWALRQACADLARLRNQGLPTLRMAVNVSPRQFRAEGLLDSVEQALSAAGLQGTALELEITESVLMSSVQKTQQLLQTLRAQGVRIAVDDFGTGYSSLSYLADFPVQVVKIDRSFVRQVDTRERAATLAGAIVAMAHSLGLQVVAEGVESPAQQQHLARLGCNLLQGFLFSRPLPMAQLHQAIHALQAGAQAPLAAVESEVWPQARPAAQPITWQ